MRRLLMVLAVPACVAVLVSCSTITEELPTHPQPVGGSGGPTPIVVVPIPVPSPEAPSGGAPPAPIPTPRPVPTAAPAPGPGIPPNIPNNNSPVARVGAKIYFVECNGAEVPGTEHATTAPVGCRIHLDCTPRDASNQPTTAVGTPSWTYSDTSIITIGGRSPYNPVLTARAPGQLSMYATIDGVRSADVRIRIE